MKAKAADTGVVLTAYQSEKQGQEKISYKKSWNSWKLSWTFQVNNISWKRLTSSYIKPINVEVSNNKRYNASIRQMWLTSQYGSICFRRQIRHHYCSLTEPLNPNAESQNATDCMRTGLKWLQGSEHAHSGSLQAVASFHCLQRNPNLHTSKTWVWSRGEITLASQGSHSGRNSLSLTSVKL